MNNVLFIVLDSCRFDTFQAARTPFMDKLGKTEQRFSFASWTFPSHAVYLMGVTPHASPQHVFASEVYKNDFSKWSVRLGIAETSFQGFVPQLSLPLFLQNLGYRTHALVSMPVLNQTTMLNQYFDRYLLMDAHNDFSAMLELLEFDSDQPSFYLLNVGETHYPYTLVGESEPELPRLHGVHGVLKHYDDYAKAKESDTEKFREEMFSQTQIFSRLKDKQQGNVEYLDGLFEKLYDIVPENTHIIVTSDHGSFSVRMVILAMGQSFIEKYLKSSSSKDCVPSFLLDIPK